MKIFKVEDDYENMRLDRYLLKQARFLSKPQLEKMIRKSDVKLNGKKAHADDRLKAGDSISVYALYEENLMYKADMSLPAPDVLYEDEFILAVNKPPYLHSQSPKKAEDSLNERVRAYLFEEAKKYGGAFVPGIANRLDTNTSGIVLCGKTPASSKQLSELIRKGELDKRYYALVYGNVTKTIKCVCYGKKDAEKNIVSISEEAKEGYVKMASVFSPVKTTGDFTLLDVKLITGRTHQIRSQLAYLGFPVAGDYKYGNPAVNRRLEKEAGLKRQFLHAYKVSFKLWYDDSVLSISCPMYEDLNEVAERLEEGI